jgi:hypothetical protein
LGPTAGLCLLCLLSLLACVFAGCVERGLTGTATVRMRPDYAGLEPGLDAKRSIRVMNRLEPLDVGCLRTIQVGAHVVGNQGCHFVEEGTKTCPFCDLGLDETREHLFWECPRWAAQRGLFPQVLAADRASWPRCRLLFGVVPQTRERVFDALVATAPALMPVSQLPPPSPGGETVLTMGLHLRGSVANPPRAGTGAFWRPGDPRNLCSPLWGSTRTPYAAALGAVVLALLHPREGRGPLTVIVGHTPALRRLNAEQRPTPQPRDEDCWHLLGECLRLKDAAPHPVVFASPAEAPLPAGWACSLEKDV